MVDHTVTTVASAVAPVATRVTEIVSAPLAPRPAPGPVPVAAAPSAPAGSHPPAAAVVAPLRSRRAAAPSRDHLRAPLPARSLAVPGATSIPAPNPDDGAPHASGHGVAAVTPAGARVEPTIPGWTTAAFAVPTRPGFATGLDRPG